MDLASVNSIPVTAPVNRQVDSSRGNGSGSGFSVALAGTADDAPGRIERAESMVGERIRAPEGGCGCDALVRQATAAPDLASGRATLTEAVRAQGKQPSRTVAPGDIIEIAPPSRGEAGQATSEVDLTDHVHQAIVRNATEMIGVDSDGMVQVLAIPWSRVTRR